MLNTQTQKVVNRFTEFGIFTSEGAHYMLSEMTNSDSDFKKFDKRLRAFLKRVEKAHNITLCMDTYELFRIAVLDTFSSDECWEHLDFSSFYDSLYWFTDQTLVIENILKGLKKMRGF